VPGGKVAGFAAKPRPSGGIPPPPGPALPPSGASLFGQWQGTLETRSLAPINADVQAQLDAPGARQGGAIPGAVLPGIGELTVVAGRIAGDVEQVTHRIGTPFSDTPPRALRQAIGNVNQLTTTLNSAAQRPSKDLDRAS